jgi:hypothetical protein
VAEDLVIVDPGPRDPDLTEEDLAEPGLSWVLLLLVSYSSAITLALAWILWTGRAARLGQPPPDSPAAAPAESVSRAREPERAAPAPPIPPENLAPLGQTIRLGDLEVTPQAVVATPLELVRSIEPPESRREEGEVLVLRLRLVNISQDRSFAPLDPSLVRERGLRPHDPYIATSRGPNIRLYPLAIESEWSILGQDFDELAPRQATVTIVAAEPGSVARLSPQMTWRVWLRTGVYRTDMLGVRFTSRDVRHVWRVDDAAEAQSPRRAIYRQFRIAARAEALRTSTKVESLATSVPMLPPMWAGRGDLVEVVAIQAQAQPGPQLGEVGIEDLAQPGVEARR